MNTKPEGDLSALLVRRRIIEEVGALLGRRRISQSELARRLDWTQPYLSRRMTGKTAFSTDDLTQIAEEFSVSVIDLFGTPTSSEPRRRDSGCNRDSLNSDETSAEFSDYAHVA